MSVAELAGSCLERHTSSAVVGRIQTFSNSPNAGHVSLHFSEQADSPQTVPESVVNLTDKIGKTGQLRSSQRIPLLNEYRGCHPIRVAQRREL